MTSYMLQKSWF